MPPILHRLRAWLVSRAPEGHAQDTDAWIDHLGVDAEEWSVS